MTLPSLPIPLSFIPSNDSCDNNKADDVDVVDYDTSKWSMGGANTTFINTFNK